jgi:DNA-binding NtrC family response regulator
VDVSSATLDAVVGYDWPGNVRELENTIERAVLFSRGSAIDIADLPDMISRSSVSADAAESVAAQHRHRIDVRRAAGRYVGGNYRDERKCDRYRNEHRRFPRI